MYPKLYNRYSDIPRLGVVDQQVLQQFVDEWKDGLGRTGICKIYKRIKEFCSSVIFHSDWQVVNAAVTSIVK